MPHIALVTTSYPDGTPGADAAGSFVEDFAVELARAARVTVIAASRRESVDSDGNLCVRRFQVPRLPLSLLRAQNPRDWPALASTLCSGRRALRRVVESESLDHVLALWVLPCGWWAAAEAQPRGIPYSTWALGSDIWSVGKIPLVRRVLKDTLHSAARRYADGLGLCAEVEELCDLPCAFLPSSRRLPRLGEHAVAAKPPFKLAFLGRWHPNKGADLLMEALDSLVDDDWSKIDEVRLFGGGPLDREVRSAIDRLVANHRPVTVGGYLDKNQAARLISWADYLLLPSRIESIPVIYSDAVQLGTPIVSTPVGDLPGLHSRYETGVMAEEVSGASFAAAIRTALSDDPRRFASPIAAARDKFDLVQSVRSFTEDIRPAS